MKSNTHKKSHSLTQHMKTIHIVFIALGVFVGVFALTLILAPLAQSSTPSAQNVAVIPISGAITLAGSSDFFSPQTASATDIVRFIEQADETRGIRMIVLEINSPGGSAVASEEIAAAIRRAEKPTVAWIREVGASGAYWIASQTDYVIANPMSITGSVGVIASYLEFSEFLARYNVSYEQLTAGENKDVGSPFVRMTDEQRSMLQAQLDSIHDYFVEDVARGRALDENQTAQVRTGMFFLGTQARDLGLVDELGGRYEVEAYLEEQLGTTPRYRRFERQRGFFEQLAGVLHPGIPVGVRVTS